MGHKMGEKTITILTIPDIVRTTTGNPVSGEPIQQIAVSETYGETVAVTTYCER